MQVLVTSSTIIDRVQTEHFYNSITTSCADTMWECLFFLFFLLELFTVIL